MPGRLVATLTHSRSDRESDTSSNEAAACLCSPVRLTRKESALGQVNLANKALKSCRPRIVLATIYAPSIRCSLNAER